MRVERGDLEQIVQEFKYRGLFSEYLPPNFSLESGNIDLFRDAILSESNEYIEPYKYTMSRFTDNDKRRVIYLPEITAYLSMTKYIEENDIIDELIDFSMSGDNSFSKIVQEDGSILKYERIYDGEYEDEEDDKFIQSTYIPNVVEKINRARGARGILYLDISNFYGSVYTHILPSILLGYENAMKQYKIYLGNKRDERVTDTYKKYHKLDEKVRALNSNRTNGLLTGPLISYFLAEAILTRIDEEIKSHNISFVRYIDDYEVFIYDDYDIEKQRSIMSDIIGRYHLTFNHEKTKYIEFPYYAIENLEKMYKKFTNDEIDSADLIQLFNKYFSLEKDGTKGAIRYLIKSIDKRFIVNDHELYASFLFNVLVNDNRSLIKVCELIVKEKSNLQISSNHIEIIKKLVYQCIRDKKELEVVWLIYLLENLGITELDADIIKEVIQSKNELAMIMLIEEYENCLDEDMKYECLQYANSWILLYQLFLKDFITELDFIERLGLKKNISFYKKLKYKKFSFYKPNDKVQDNLPF